ncbi:hypothetical protein BWO91_14630 [Plantibacter flavus]|uniref:YybH family protein n=1 Tax=Plantibacter TaxID=190323 RepID=UPI0009C31FBD|nr:MULTISPECIES: nuclear transport factor 2 family protein [Plantibacter]AQX82255.1 hypothetical protein BWO91_14630 [Plantibacter flavus]
MSTRHQSNSRNLTDDPSFLGAVARVDIALKAMGHGESELFANCWAHREDTSLYGAFGTREHGFEAISATLAWVASRLSDGDLVPQYELMTSSADFGYTVGFERGFLRVDGGEPGPFEVRVTHVFRKIEDDWLIVHRHGDHPPRL